MVAPTLSVTTSREDLDANRERFTISVTSDQAVSVSITNRSSDYRAL